MFTSEFDPKSEEHHDSEWQAAQFHDNKQNSDRKRFEGATYPPEGNKPFLVQINLWKTGRHKRWIFVMLHEAKHVHGCHHTKTKASNDKFNESVYDVVELVKKTHTIDLFDDWFKYYSKEKMPYDRLQKAAEGALTGKKPPPKKK